MTALTSEAPWVRVELCAGTVTAARIDTQDRFFEITDWQALYRYFVYVVDAEGNVLGVDTADDYHEAVGLAQQVRTDFGISSPVRDWIAEAH